MTLSKYLTKYYKIQKEIPLIYRPTEKHWWTDRCIFLDEKYSDRKKYNHRMILDNEVVIEFDEDDRDTNKKLAESVKKRLIKDKIPYSLWWSGNKSYHLHFFIELANVQNRRLLKKVVMRYYTNHLDQLPDLQLAGSHTIRAEYGVHEKTQKCKERVIQSPNYPKVSMLPAEVWKLYYKEMEKVAKWRMTTATSDLSESNLIKKLLDTKNFDKFRDGRERIIFVLSNVLQSKYDKNELSQLLVSWYKYTNGRKLSEGQIKYKVRRAYSKPYNITERYINELLEDLKATDL